MPNIEFKPPENVLEAQERINTLKQEIRSIQLQLENRDVHDEFGVRMNAEAYNTWKQRAKHALIMRCNEKDNLTLWRMKQDNRIREWILINECDVDPNNTGQLLASTYGIIKRLMARYKGVIELDYPEQDLLDYVRAKLPDLPDE